MSKTIKISEDDLNRIKTLINELRHFVCNIESTEYVAPDKFRKPFTEEEKAKISELSEQGLNTYQISQELGRKYNSVRNYLKGKKGQKGNKD